jgi:hypothetical protein
VNYDLDLHGTNAAYGMHSHQLRSWGMRSCDVPNRLRPGRAGPGSAGLAGRAHSGGNINGRHGCRRRRPAPGPSVALKPKTALRTSCAHGALGGGGAGGQSSRRMSMRAVGCWTKASRIARSCASRGPAPHTQAARQRMARAGPPPAGLQGARAWARAY